jgi:hypothetical protein
MFFIYAVGVSGGLLVRVRSVAETDLPRVTDVVSRGAEWRVRKDRPPGSCVSSVKQPHVTTASRKPRRGMIPSPNSPG